MTYSNMRQMKKGRPDMEPDVSVMKQ
jgi:hypothetical protein